MLQVQVRSLAVRHIRTLGSQVRWASTASSPDPATAGSVDALKHGVSVTALLVASVRGKETELFRDPYASLLAGPEGDKLVEAWQASTKVKIGTRIQVSMSAHSLTLNLTNAQVLVNARGTRWLHHRTVSVFPDPLIGCPRTDK